MSLRNGSTPAPDGAIHNVGEQMIVWKRRAIAAAMRRGGATWQMIADTAVFPDGTRCYAEGTSKAQVYVDVKRGLEEATRELALEMGELRQQESDRLDDYLLRLRAGILEGDPKAINTAVRITEVRARLYGLNEPERHEVITVDALDAERRRLVDELNRRAALEARNDRGNAGATPTESGPR